MSGVKERLAPFAIANRERGLCGCGRPPKPDRKSCAVCMAKCREATKARRKLPGHCRGCGKANQTRKLCDTCRPSWNARDRRKRAERRARGLCHNCGLPSVPGKSLCAAHAERNRVRSGAYMRAKRARQP